MIGGSLGCWRAFKPAFRTVLQVTFSFLRRLFVSSETFRWIRGILSDSP
jgi:hypothetical protein